MGVSARLAKKKNSIRADLFWRIAISVLGALLILLALQDFSLFFFGKTAVADVNTRRVGGERDGLGNDKRYSWSVDYTFPADGRTFEGHTTRLGSATSVAVSRTVYYLSVCPVPEQPGGYGPAQLGSAGHAGRGCVSPGCDEPAEKDKKDIRSKRPELKRG